MTSEDGGPQQQTLTGTQQPLTTPEDVRGEDGEVAAESYQDKSQPVTELREDGVVITNSDVTKKYESWETPNVIISDGAYGTGHFPGEPDKIGELTDWYRPHIKAWSKYASPATTLFLWNTEEGFAEIHPLLKAHGWEYRGLNTWDKGIAHIAGNSNTKRMRKFPQVSEACVHYVRSREAVLELTDEQRDVQQWMRDEWKRAELDFQEANEACGVASAATRKYFASDSDWYFPPPERFQKLRDYANTHGAPSGRPYLSPDGLPFNPNDEENTGASMLHRATFNCPVGVTNVWQHPQVSGEERITDQNGDTLHPNQKPIELIHRLIRAGSNENDVVWEPFGGLCTGAVAAKELGRDVFAAEIVDEYYEAGVKRVSNAVPGNALDEDEQYSLSSF